MSLEIKFGKSRWWYGRVTVRGRVLCKNLGVEIAGNPPARLSEVGDIVFERSRSKAQAALERFQIEIRKRSAAEELVQTIHEIRTGERIRSIELKDIAAHWKDLPRRRPLSKSYLMQADMQSMSPRGLRAPAARRPPQESRRPSAEGNSGASHAGGNSA